MIGLSLSDTLSKPNLSIRLKSFAYTKIYSNITATFDKKLGCFFLFPF